MEKSERKSSEYPKNVFRGSGESLRKLLGEANGALQDGRGSECACACISSWTCDTLFQRSQPNWGNKWKKKLGHCDTKKKKKKVNFIRIKVNGQYSISDVESIAKFAKNKTS